MSCDRKACIEYCTAHAEEQLSHRLVHELPGDLKGLWGQGSREDANLRIHTSLTICLCSTVLKHMNQPLEQTARLSHACL